MKSIFLVTAMVVVQSGVCQSIKPKAGAKVITKTASAKTVAPHRNLNEPMIYTFIGNGNWDDKSNWDTNGVPPVDNINLGSEIRINSNLIGAKCILNVPYEVPNTTKTIKLIVYKGNQLVVPDLIVK